MVSFPGLSSPSVCCKTFLPSGISYAQNASRREAAHCMAPEANKKRCASHCERFRSSRQHDASKCASSFYREEAEKFGLVHATPKLIFSISHSDIFDHVKDWLASVSCWRGQSSSIFVHSNFFYGALRFVDLVFFRPLIGYCLAILGLHATNKKLGNCKCSLLRVASLRSVPRLQCNDMVQCNIKKHFSASNASHKT